MYYNLSNIAALCEDGDLRLVGGATDGEGRLEICFGKRWGTIDGDGWTHTDTQVACRQLGHSIEGSYVSILKCSYFNYTLYEISSCLISYVYRYLNTAVSETRRRRNKYQVNTFLPTFITRVGCYGSEEKLINCSYHKFETTTSMDVSINCGSDDDTIGAHHALKASLSISVIFAVAFIALLVVLIIITVLRQMKNSTKRFVIIISFSSS